MYPGPVLTATAPVPKMECLNATHVKGSITVVWSAEVLVRIGTNVCAVFKIQSLEGGAHS
jgi:hypothetical protein